MNDKNIILNDLRNSIKDIKQLTISEAQDLYKKAIDPVNHRLKNDYINKLILETLYVVYNYIENNQIEIFASSTYDIKDIISAITETWIKRIYKGELLNVTQFSLLFNQPFFNAVYQNLGGGELETFVLFEIPAADFIELFANFIELKNKGINFKVSDVTGDYFKSIYRYYYSDYENNLVALFEKIYENLNLNEVDDLNISKNKIRNYLKLIISAGLQEPISDTLKEEHNMENQIIDDIISKPFIRDVNTVLKNPKLIETIHLYFGLEDETQHTLKETAKIQNRNTETVRLRLIKSYRILRKSPKIRKYQ